MPVNTTELQKVISDLTAQVAQTTTVEASAAALIQGYSAQVQAAVTAALAADDAADQGSIDAATAAIKDTAAGFAASSAKLGDAVTANTPSAPPA